MDFSAFVCYLEFLLLDILSNIELKPQTPFILSVINTFINYIKKNLINRLCLHKFSFITIWPSGAGAVSGLVSIEYWKFLVLSSTWWYLYHYYQLQSHWSIFYRDNGLDWRECPAGPVSIVATICLLTIRTEISICSSTDYCATENCQVRWETKRGTLNIVIYCF